MVNSKYIILAKTLRKTLYLKQKDRVLLITDNSMEKTAKPFFNISKSLAPNTTMLKIKETGSNGKEPPKKIAKIMKNFDVVMALTTFSLTHTRAVIDAREKGIRIASLPGFSDRMIEALNIDYDRLKKNCMKLKKILESSSNIHATTPSGSDINFSSQGCRITADIGDSNRSIINLPAGEVFLPPKKMSGTLVIDEMKKNVKITINENRVKNIQPSRAGNRIKKILSVPGGKNIAEFGIGMNRKANIIGSVLMDEKVMGTCHIAFGDNSGFGGSVKSSVHQDFILSRPTIIIDERIIMKNGVPRW